MSDVRFRSILFFSSGLAALAGTAFAQAPPSAPSPKPATGTASVSEIIVTARRRAESLSKVPITVSVLNGSNLREKGITTETDLQSAVPGLSVVATQQQNQLAYSIRGQSVDSLSGSVQAVLPYIDDVQVNTQSASTFYDLANIQVLKGPQGTLFGRNTTGGAVLSTTAPATDIVGGYLQIDVGDYDLRRFQGAVNFPIVPEKALFRFAFDSDNEDGYVKNVYDGSRQGTTDAHSERATLELHPSDQIKNTTVFQYNQDNGTNLSGSLYDVYPCGSPNVGVPVACIYGPATAALLNQSNPKVYPGGLASFLDYQNKTLGFFQQDDSSPAGHRSDGYVLANTTVDELTPTLRVTNIVGVARANDADQNELVGSPYQAYSLGAGGNAYTTQQYSDEVRVSGEALNKKLDYVVGFYYSYERDEADLTTCILCDLSAIGISPIRSEYHYQTIDQSEAAFAQGTYALGIQGLSVTAGFRETWEQVRLERLQGDAFGGDPQSDPQSNPSWNVSLQYQVNPRLMFYVTQRGSWRAGGFRGTAASTSDEFKPETVRDVEVGAKFNGYILGRRARLNADIYEQWISDAQRNLYLFDASNGSFAFFTGNVPQAQISGAELDGDVQVTSWLKLGGALSSMQAQYTDNKVTIPGYSTLTFGPYGDAPKWSGSVFGEVALPSPGAVGEMAVRTDIYAQSSYFFSNLANTLTPGTQIPAYYTINMRYEWRQIMGSKITASLFVKNLADEHYYLGGLPLGAILGLNTAVPAPPRTFGVSLRAEF
jgi:iron complex outermembrane receptor protein